ncbi:MAG: CHAT domain-containing protein [Chloracidobacterium sp.]|nr:CHAT domain-containing protein [Chloracidobacterium sp.]
MFIGTPSILSVAPKAPHPDAARQDDQQVQRLERGKPIERELAGDQSQVYQLSLDAGQYVKLVLDQRGIDVVVRILGPDAGQAVEFDSESRPIGQESMSLASEEAGNYRLIVRPKYKAAPGGRYEFRIEESRAATNDDLELQEARRSFQNYLELYRAGKYDEAIPLVERALEIRKKLLGPDHQDVAAAILGLANLYRDKGEYAKAEPLYRQGLEISEKALGTDHRDVARAINELAIFYWHKGDYASAESLCQRALGVWERALGLDHPEAALTFNNLAITYYRKGQYEKAERFFLRALDIWEKALGPEHSNVLRALNNLAALYHERCEYVKAEPLYRRVVDLREKTLKPDHPDIAGTLNNLAILYRDIGDYAKAESLHQRALTILEKALGPEHPNVAQILNELARLYAHKGEYAKAEQFYKRALVIDEKTSGPEHFEVAEPLSNLAILYQDIAQYAKAEECFQRALDIRKKALGPNHSLVATSLNGLATLYRDKGAYEKAEPLYRQAIDIWEKSMGAETPYVANALNRLAALYVMKGDIDQALTALSRANAVSERNLELNLAIGSERQKLAYLALFAEETDFTLSFHSLAAPDDPRVADLALTTLLRRKGRGLDAMVDTITTLRRHASPEDQKFFDQLADARAQLAALTLGGPGGAPLDIYQKRLRPFEAEVEKLEAELSARSDRFFAQTQPITLAAVQAALPTNGALIEFAVYTPHDPRTLESGPPRYIAYALAAQGQPKWADIGEAAVIDHAVDALRKALSNPGQINVKRLARAVDEKVMRPLRPLLGEARRLLVAPDGSLNLIPFAALVDEQNRYLIERYTISYLTSGRDLLRLQRSNRKGSAPMIMANPAFGRAAPTGARAGQNAAGLRSGDPGSRQNDPGQIYFQPLPHTRREALAIKAAFPEASVLLRGKATETALKRAKAPRILHIATHGFFLGDQEAPPAEARGFIDDDPVRASGLKFSKWAAKIENPLLRSGIALTGANQVRSGGDDGLLTALEVAGLDLWGTKLVTLSACETGVGEVKNGEGVQGLRRALVLAGSESQVMSLWPVLDSATVDLMIQYYKALRQGKGRSEGLRQAQLRMLRSKDSQHPFYWAAFIQSGEWANLYGRRAPDPPSSAGKSH